MSIADFLRANWEFFLFFLVTCITRLLMEDSDREGFCNGVKSGNLNNGEGSCPELKSDIGLKYGKEWTLVMFYSPDCPFSAEAKPNFFEASKSVGSWIQFAIVDCLQTPQLCAGHKISGYPTFLLFKGGILVEEYKGGRSAQEFLEYSKSPPNPSWWLLRWWRHS